MIYKTNNKIYSLPKLGYGIDYRNLANGIENQFHKMVRVISVDISNIIVLEVQIMSDDTGEFIKFLSKVFQNVEYRVPQSEINCKIQTGIIIKYNSCFDKEYNFLIKTNCINIFSNICYVDLEKLNGISKISCEDRDDLCISDRHNSLLKEFIELKQMNKDFIIKEQKYSNYSMSYKKLEELINLCNHHVI